MTRDLFDLELGRELREDGKEAAAVRNEEWLDKARSAAIVVYERRGSVTTDDLRPYLVFVPGPSHPNCWGAVFKRDQWECIGWTESRRSSAHARAIRVWKLKEKP